jgi:hypothetical protein
MNLCEHKTALLIECTRVATIDCEECGAHVCEFHAVPCQYCGMVLCVSCNWSHERDCIHRRAEEFPAA